MPATAGWIRVSGVALRIRASHCAQSPRLKRRSCTSCCATHRKVCTPCNSPAVTRRAARPPHLHVLKALHRHHPIVGAGCLEVHQVSGEDGQVGDAALPAWAARVQRVCGCRRQSTSSWARPPVKTLAPGSACWPDPACLIVNQPLHRRTGHSRKHLTHLASSWMNARCVRLLDTAVMADLGYLAAMNRLQEPHPHPSSSTCVKSRQGDGQLKTTMFYNPSRGGNPAKQAPCSRFPAAASSDPRRSPPPAARPPAEPARNTALA